MRAQRRANARHDNALPKTDTPLRFLRSPYQFTVQLGLVSWREMRVTCTIEQRGQFRTTSTRTVHLDLEARLPSELNAELAGTLEDFIRDEWIERVSRTF